MLEFKITKELNPNPKLVFMNILLLSLAKR